MAVFLERNLFVHTIQSYASTEGLNPHTSQTQNRLPYLYLLEDLSSDFFAGEFFRRCIELKIFKIYGFKTNKQRSVGDAKLLAHHIISSCLWSGLFPAQ